MRKYKTKKEEWEIGWENYLKREKANKWPNQIIKVGERVKGAFTKDMSVYDFVPGGGCNLFHQKDMCEIMIGLELDFKLEYWSLEGRDRFCQLSVKYRENIHYIGVRASGYGTGEGFYLSSDFPNKLKFLICREMAHEQARSDLEYYEMHIKKKFGQEGIIKTKSIISLICDYVRCYQDLEDIAELSSMLSARRTYKSASGKKLFKKEQKPFDKTWSKFIKKQVYKEYLKARRKELKENAKK